MSVSVIADDNRSVAAAVVSAGAVAIVVTPGLWALIPVAVLSLIAGRCYGDEGCRSTTLAAICWASVGFFSVVLLGVVWPIPQLIGLTLAGALLRRAGWERPTWFAPGRRDRAAEILAAASIPLTTVALVAFIASGRTDLDAATEGLQALPLWTLPIVGVGFVLVNPTVEEILFRGALQDMVTEVSARPVVGIATQAFAFGAIHLNGVPGGPLGVVMATGWGIMLGVVRHRTGSIRLAWVVHAMANIAIYTTVVLLAIDDGVL